MKYRITTKLNAEGGKYWRVHTRQWWIWTWDFEGSYTNAEDAEAHVEALRNVHAKPVTVKEGTI